MLSESHYFEIRKYSPHPFYTRQPLADYKPWQVIFKLGKIVYLFQKQLNKRNQDKHKSISSSKDFFSGFLSEGNLILKDGMYWLKYWPLDTYLTDEWDQW